MARKGALQTIVGAVCGLVLWPAGAALGEVLSIGDDGAVTTYAAPSVFTSDGAMPIEASTADAATPAEVAAAIRESAARHAVPAPLVEAVAWQESHYNQAAISPKGARGVMQLMPATALTLGVDAADLKSNIDGGAAYLAQQIRRFGDLRLALAAYNAGPGAVDRYGDIPPYAETQTYVRNILQRLAAATMAAAGK
jgi:soluble lytic murein transglycosylase-like protein